MHKPMQRRMPMQRRILHRQILETVKNVAERPPFHTKTANILSADFENGKF